MQLREEQLQARKTTVETGHVSLGKEVIEERTTVDVPVTREEVYVERQPFLFFADFGGDLAKAVRDGRRAEFAGFPPFDDEEKAQGIPDPGAQSTFAHSRLDWQALEREQQAAWLRLYRELLAIRRRHIVPLLDDIVPGGARFRTQADSLDVSWPLRKGRRLHLALRLAPGSDAAETAIYQSPPHDAWHVRWTIEHG